MPQRQCFNVDCLYSYLYLGSVLVAFDHGCRFKAIRIFVVKNQISRPQGTIALCYCSMFSAWEYIRSEQVIIFSISYIPVEAFVGRYAGAGVVGAGGWPK